MRCPPVCNRAPIATDCCTWRSRVLVNRARTANGVPRAQGVGWYCVGLHDVEPLFRGVEPDLVGADEIVGNQAQTIVVHHRDVAVGGAFVDRPDPGIYPGGHRDPDATPAVGHREVDLAQGLPASSVHRVVEWTSRVIRTARVPKLAMIRSPFGAKVIPLGSDPASR